MTLAQIAAYACLKVQLSDATTLTTAKSFAAARWRMLWDAADWRQARHATTQTVEAGVQDVTLNADFGLIQAASWNGDTELPVVSERSLLAADASALAATGTPGGYVVLPKVAGVCRLRLIPTPTMAGELMVIGKRNCPALEADTDEPDLPGAAESLCSFVEGDLWRSIFRQFSKGQACYDEANALLLRMRDLETNQSTNAWRIVPSVGSGYDSGWLDKN